MELTDQKDFIKEEIIRQERLKTSKAVLHHGATHFSDVVFNIQISKTKQGNLRHQRLLSGIGISESVGENVF